MMLQIAGSHSHLELRNISLCVCVCVCVCMCLCVCGIQTVLWALAYKIASLLSGIEPQTQTSIHHCMVSSSSTNRKDYPVGKRQSLHQMVLGQLDKPHDKE